MNGVFANTIRFLRNIDASRLGFEAMAYIPSTVQKISNSGYSFLYTIVMGVVAQANVVNSALCQFLIHSIINVLWYSFGPSANVSISIGSRVRVSIGSSEPAAPPLTTWDLTPLTGPIFFARLLNLYMSTTNVRGLKVSVNDLFGAAPLLTTWEQTPLTFRIAVALRLVFTATTSVCVQMN